MEETSVLLCMSRKKRKRIISTQAALCYDVRVYFQALTVNIKITQETSKVDTSILKAQVLNSLKMAYAYGADYKSKAVAPRPMQHQTARAFLAVRYDVRGKLRRPSTSLYNADLNIPRPWQYQFQQFGSFPLAVPDWAQPFAGKGAQTEGRVLHTLAGYGVQKLS